MAALAVSVCLVGSAAGLIISGAVGSTPRTSTTAADASSSNVASFGGSAVGMWAVTTSGALKLSDDDGSTWTQASLPNGVTPGPQTGLSAAIHGSTVWLGASGANKQGLYVSHDSGQNWSQASLPTLGTSSSVDVEPGASGAANIVEDAQDSVLSGQAVLYRTSSSASSALTSQVQLPTQGTVSAVSANAAYLVGGPGNQSAYESTDGESTWTKLTVPPEIPNTNYTLGAPVMLGGAVFIPVTTLPPDGSTELDLYPVPGGTGTTPSSGRVLSLQESGVTASAVATSSAGGAVWAVSPDGSHVSVATSLAGWTTVTASGLPAGVSVTAISATQAFAFESNASCTNKTSCVLTTGLYETTDGGKTWTAVNV